MSLRSVLIALAPILFLACELPENVKVPWQEEPEVAARPAPRGPALGSPVTPAEIDRQVQVARIHNVARAAVRQLVAER